MRIGAVILASGDSLRFGDGNKLLAPFEGKPILAHVLDALPADVFAARLVVTRLDQIARLARETGFDALMHDLPDISDTVRLGTQAMRDMDGCLFAVGDQPLLTQGTVRRLAVFFAEQPSQIARVGKNGRAGNPAIFPPEYYAELCALPKGRGGNEIMRAHPERVRMMEVGSERELFDIDTRREYEKLHERV